jgi:hypothetical protein
MQPPMSQQPPSFAHMLPAQHAKPVAPHVPHRPFAQTVPAVLHCAPFA